MRASKVVVLASLLLFPMMAAAAEGQPGERTPGGRGGRHFILETSTGVLSETQVAELAAKGVEVQKALTRGRYLVRAEASATEGLKVQALTREKKLHRSAFREAAKARAFAPLHILFHDDVTFEDAKQAIADAGGTLLDPLTTGFGVLNRIDAQVPTGAVLRLGDDERVFQVYGAPIRQVKTHNATSATNSSVPPLHAAPYNLTGKDVVLSYFELGPPDVAHPEFQGRVQFHCDPCPNTSEHATHVGGTMVAAGTRADAKGMAPAATLHWYRGGSGQWLNTKANALQPIGSVADNNSWGFILGWQNSDSDGWVWTEDDELIGGYDFLTATLDNISRTKPTLFIHSAGNEGNNGGPVTPPNVHKHQDENGRTIVDKFYCYSQNGSGTDCPTDACSVGAQYCETIRHPTHQPYGSIGWTASAKNVLAVGATDTLKFIASFSSRGPARDGRVKPEVVARGVNVLSTTPNGGYGRSQGTSMSAPAVTGISALIVEQYRKQFGTSPSNQMIKTLLIAGADEIGNPGPDYTYGFGYVNAKASIDLLMASGTEGKRIKTASLATGGTQEFSVNVPSTQDLKVVLTWSDPEVLILGDELAEKALINDLDVKVIGPDGAEVLPYVLDRNAPTTHATRGVNTVDNVEVVEVKGAAAGTYKVRVTGTRVPTASPQQFLLTANADFGADAPPCIDPTEPNDSEGVSANIATGGSVFARVCAAGDADFFRFTPNAAGTVRVAVAANDTNVRVSLINNGSTIATSDVPAGQSRELTATATSSTWFVKVEPNGTIGANPSYTVTVTYPATAPPRRRGARE